METVIKTVNPVTSEERLKREKEANKKRMIGGIPVMTGALLVPVGIYAISIHSNLGIGKSIAITVLGTAIITYVAMAYSMRKM